MVARLSGTVAVTVTLLAAATATAPPGAATARDTTQTSTTVPTPSTTEAPPTTAPPTTDPGTPTTTVAPAPQPSEPEAPTSPPVEREAEYLPEEDLAAARAELDARLAQVGDLQTAILQMKAQIEAELGQLDARLAAAEADAAAAKQASLEAETAREEADSRARAAQEEAQRSQDDATKSIVDAFMNPMTTATVRSLGDQNEATYARGLMDSRADHRVELARAADRAESAAQKAGGDAALAAATAEEASLAAREALGSVNDARTARLWELEDLATFTVALAEQTDVLGQFDGVLAQQELIQMIESRIASTRPVEREATVRIPGTTIDVHHLITDQATAMIEAARQEGVPLDGWGWRSHQRQIELRAKHCGSDPYSLYEAPSSSCSPPTARPGNSMHERGVAIDFKDCSTRATACYGWLAEHAHLYGFYNLPSEPWHWSTNGR